MSVFGDYSEYYDLFYADKDYAREARFVSGLLRKHARAAHTIVELGCGTARHALELVRSGYAVTGVDVSPGMVARGRAAAASLPKNVRGRLRVVEGDVTTFTSPETYDAAISLFHVVNYQTTNQALASMFRAARQAVRLNGVFVFDFWYGPAVLSDRPSVRIRRVSTSSARVTRLAEPVVHANRNTVDVNYTLFVEHLRSGRMKEFTETHSMRYLFLPEVEMLAAGAGFELVKTGGWLTRRPLDDQTWLGYAVARAI
jgi:SAM-dependent methyltransferase